MKIRMSEDFGQVYQNHNLTNAPLQDPASPLFNKKSQTTGKAGIQEMIAGANNPNLIQTGRMINYSGATSAEGDTYVPNYFQ